MIHNLDKNYTVKRELECHKIVIVETTGNNIIKDGRCDIVLFPKNKTPKKKTPNAINS